MKFDCLTLDDVRGFDWDDGNIYKNEKKHGIKWQEIEEVFFNEPLLIYEDIKHSQNECRCYVLGVTDENKKLFVVFTKRNKKIRVISARIMNKKERAIYEKYQKNT
jgi:uncharacterized DUF497 family protein